MDHNTPSSYQRVFKSQISVIKAWKTPRPRTSIDGLIDGKNKHRNFQHQDRRGYK